MTTTRVVEVVRTLELDGVDLLLIEVPGNPSPETMGQLRRHLQDAVALRGHNCQVLVHQPGLRFTLVKDPAGVVLARDLEEGGADAARED